MTVREQLLQERKDAKAALIQKAKDAQASCQHDHVVHWTGQYSSDHQTHPMRLCIDCGFEEKGSWWSYAGPSLDSEGKMQELWRIHESDSVIVLGLRKGRYITVTRSSDGFSALRLFL